MLSALSFNNLSGDTIQYYDSLFAILGVLCRDHKDTDVELNDMNFMLPFQAADLLLSCPCIYLEQGLLLQMVWQLTKQ